VPIPIRRGAPKYPVKLRKAGIEGVAVIEFVGSEEGLTTDIFAIRADVVSLAEATAAAVSQWKFLPAKKDDKLVACRLQVPIIFELASQ